VINDSPSRVLVVDDSESIRKRIAQILALRRWDVAAVGSAEQARTALGAEEFDVLAIDMTMPGTSGLALLREIRQTDTDTCIVMLTGEGDIERAAECAEAGADDFLEKASFEPLQGSDFRLRRAFATRLLELERRRIAGELHEANEHLQQANAELESLSRTDQLTGLANRRHIEQKLQEEIERCSRYGHCLGVALLDLDHFKKINDTAGHQAGDRVLSDFGRLLTDSLRATDAAGRYGGEEFLVLFPETDLDGVRVCLERLRREASAAPLGPPGLRAHVTVSCGGTAARPKDRDAETAMRELVSRADEALYEAKNTGRNRVVVSAAG
jgi:diguanylate cyclase (GGDEF)-like protein